VLYGTAAALLSRPPLDGLSTRRSHVQTRKLGASWVDLMPTIDNVTACVTSRWCNISWNVTFPLSDASQGTQRLALDASGSSLDYDPVNEALRVTCGDGNSGGGGGGDGTTPRPCCWSELTMPAVRVALQLQEEAAE
jgi:hypothetical protein